ncbi:MAG: response regulator [Blautia wexlerae]
MEICGEAEDGEEALKKILEEKPDILIMDINIPYMNGIEVSKKSKGYFSRNTSNYIDRLW